MKVIASKLLVQYVTLNLWSKIRVGGCKEEEVVRWTLKEVDLPQLVLGLMMECLEPHIVLLGLHFYVEEAW